MFKIIEQNSTSRLTETLQMTANVILLSCNNSINHNFDKISDISGHNLAYFLRAGINPEKASLTDGC